MWTREREREAAGGQVTSCSTNVPKIERQDLPRDDCFLAASHTTTDQEKLLQNIQSQNIFIFNTILLFLFKVKKQKKNKLK